MKLYKEKILIIYVNAFYVQFFFLSKTWQKVIRTTHKPFILQLFGRHLDNFYLNY
jgi:hypothetical protein